MSFKNMKHRKVIKKAFMNFFLCHIFFYTTGIDQFILKIKMLLESLLKL